MKVTKKRLFLLVSTSLCAAFLMGCQEETTPQKTTPQKESVSKEKEAKKKETDKKKDTLTVDSVKKDNGVIDLEDAKKKEEEAKKKEQKEKELAEQKAKELQSSLDLYPEIKTYSKKAKTTVNKSELKADLTLKTSYKLLMNIPAVKETLASNKKYALYVSEGKDSFDGYIGYKEGNIRKNGKLIPLETHLYRIQKASKKIYHYDVAKKSFIKIQDN